MKRNMGKVLVGVGLVLAVADIGISIWYIGVSAFVNLTLYTSLIVPLVIVLIGVSMARSKIIKA